MKQFRWIIISILLVIISSISPLAFTTHIVQADTAELGLEELTNNTDSIIIGTVIEQNSYWNDEHTRIYTSVVLSVEESLKGAASQDKITITSVGGEVEGIGEWVSEMPSFDQGEKAVVFLKKLPEEQLPEAKGSKLQLPDEQFEVFDGFRGKFTINGDKVGDLPVTELKKRINDILQSKVLSVEELELPLSQATFPYSLLGCSWPHPPAPVVHYRINENCADCTGEGAAVQTATATWNAAGAYFSFAYTGTTSATTAAYDGVNEIFWQNLGNVSTIAQTSIWYTGSTILEFDMEFNDYYTFSTATTPPSDQYDVQTIALHEFGHSLGLADLYGTGDSAKVMYGYGSPGTTKRTLNADDIAGIQSIYGALPVAPTVTNSVGASSVTSTSARLNGEITSTGG